MAAIVEDVVVASAVVVVVEGAAVIGPLHVPPGKDGDIPAQRGRLNLPGRAGGNFDAS